MAPTGRSRRTLRGVLDSRAGGLRRDGVPNGGAAWLDETAARLRREVDDGAAPRPEELTIRGLLGHFGYERRGTLIVRIVRSELDARGLSISANFEGGWLHGTVSITLDEADVDRADAKLVTDPTPRVESLTAAHHAPVSVKPDHPLPRATTLMRMWDYSQLPVWTGPRDVKGVVSWKSIGSALADGACPTTVRECMGEAHIIEADAPLAQAVTAVYEHDHVLVRARDKTIIGIVTAADLALQFKERALPFMLIGEIEAHLRNLVRGKFTLEVLNEGNDGDDEVRGPEGLTWGGFVRLLQKPANWKSLGLEVDNRVFVERLDAIREIRNDVMHFSPDPLGTTDLDQLECLVRFFRTLKPSPSPTRQ